MTHSGNNELILALNERARENALRVFISGLRKPLCDVLFSARPKDLPTALAVAQELQTSHRRYEFAEAYAMGYAIKPNRPRPTYPQYQSIEPKGHNINRPTPMEIDSGSSFFRQRINSSSPQQQPSRSLLQPQSYKFASKPRTPSMPVKFKRTHDPIYSDRSPIHKVQKVNFMPEVGTTENDDEYQSQNYDYQQDNEDYYNYDEIDVTTDCGDEINYLN